MPKSSRVLLAAALPLCLLVVAVLGPRSAGAARPAARSLLQNPDFERGMPTHPWMPSGWDTSTTRRQSGRAAARSTRDDLGMSDYPGSGPFGTGGGIGAWPGAWAHAARKVSGE